MDKLKVVVEDLTEIDDKYHDLYVLRDGKYHFDGVEGLKTQADIDRLSSSLSKEREAHKQIKERFSVLGDRDPSEIVSILDKVPELEAAAKGAGDPEKLQQLVDAKLNAVKAPLERELDKTMTANKQLSDMVEQLTQEKLSRAVHDSVIREARKANLPAEVDEDILLHADRVFEVVDGKVQTRDNVGVTPGLGPDGWLSEVLQRKPHWRGPSFGGGGKGSNGAGVYGSNPWSAKGWNKTEQGKVYREDPEKASRMAKAAGTTISGMKPKD